MGTPYRRMGQSFLRDKGVACGCGAGVQVVRVFVEDRRIVELIYNSKRATAEFAEHLIGGECCESINVRALNLVPSGCFLFCAFGCCGGCCGVHSVTLRHRARNK